jgi:hypothetical protein
VAPSVFTDTISSPSLLVETTASYPASIVVNRPPLQHWIGIALVGLAICLGCSKTGQDNGDSGVPPPQCEALRFELLQKWDQALLLGMLEGDGDDLPEHQGPGLALGDLNQDGYLDAFLSIRSAGTLALLNDGTGRLELWEGISVDGGPLPEANGLALADMDGDGDMDLAMATQDGLSHQVWVNQGDGLSWTAMTLEDSLDEGITPTWADLDGDGRLDLIIPGFGHVFPDANGRRHGIYMQQEDGSFQLERDRLPEGARSGMTYIAQPFDVDLDGDLDLYLVNDLPFDSQLLLNDGTGHFRDASEECLCTQVLSAMGLAMGDPNGDGLPDFFVTGWQQNRFFVNSGDGSFFDDAQSAGLLPGDPKSEVGWGARFADFNLDGRPDLAATFGGPTNDPSDHPKIRYEQADALWIAKGAGGFADIAKQVGWSTRALGRGLFVADMNRDDRPDIVLATNIGLEIWLSKGGCGQALTLALQGGPGDRHGEGARIRIEREDASVRYEWMQSAVSFGNAAAELYLGSPEGRRIVGLEILWADGHSQEVFPSTWNGRIQVQRE